MSESRVWAGLNDEQRNEAMLGIILDGRSPFSATKDFVATPRDIVEHMSSAGFAAFMASWQARIQASAVLYAGAAQYVMVLNTVPEAAAKMAIGPKDGIKLLGEVAKDLPMADPAGDVSDETVLRAAEVVKNNAWKLADAAPQET